MRRLSVICTIIIFTTLLGSCSKKPAIVIPEDKMVDVLSDIQIAQAIYNSYDESRFNSNEQKDVLIKSVLDKHNITQEMLDSSLVWYADNINIYVDITDSVARRLRSKSNALTDARSLALSGMSTSYEVLPSFYYLSQTAPTLSFKIDSAKIKNIGMDNFNITFDIQGLSSQQRVKSAIFYTYRDTVVKYIVPIDDNQSYAFEKPLLPDSLLQNISGYIHLRVDSRYESLPASVMIYNIRHQNDSLANDSLPKNTEVSDRSLLDSRRRNRRVLEQTPAQEAR